MASIGPISFGGLTTGLDTKSLISQLLQIERLPQKRLEQIRSRENDRITAFKDLNSKLLALSTALKKLETSTDFFVRSSTVSDATKLDTSVTSAAQPGTHSVTITSLVQAGQVTFEGKSSDTASVIGASKTITLANASTNPNAFSVTINTGGSGMSLNQLRDAINNDATLKTKVTATVLDSGVVGSATRFVLQIKANAAGTANDFTESDTFPASDLKKDTNTAVTFAATNTVFALDGSNLTRTSNVVSDALTGVTLTLKNTGTATFTISNDTTAMANNIKAVATAYNDVRSFVASKSTLDQKNPQNNGVFVGDGTVRGIIDRLQTELTRAVGGLSSDFNALNDLGITTDKTGKLAVNETTLSNALAANADSVSKIFIGGVADLADTDLAKDTQPGGLIDIRVGGIQDKVRRVGDQIDALERRLKSFEALLVRQFSALERLASAFQSQGAALNGLTPQQTTIGR